MQPLRPASQIIKRSRWLLLRNQDNLSDEQPTRLEELPAANAPLMTVYLLKTQLKQLWYAPSPPEARRRWQEWYRLTIDSGLKRMACGFRDSEYFLKKIKAAFPGNAMNKKTGGSFEPPA